jgi:signal transduction histidine kinase/DNA-binding NarL/FixJ family response regulator
MDFISHYKSVFLKQLQKYQFTQISCEGKLVASCDTLFDLSSQYLGREIFQEIPFLEGLESVVLGLQEELLIPQLQINWGALENRIFNFTFTKHIAHGEENIFWIIEDITQDAQLALQTRQAGRIASLATEFLEAKNQQMALENQLLQLQKSELERAKAFRNQLFAQIIHELRAPVQGVLGLSEVLLKTNHRPQDVEYLTGILTASKHLRTITNDLLDLTKAESGKMHFEQAPFHLKDTIAHVRLSFVDLLQQKHLHLKIDISPQVPVRLLGDATRLAQIFYNLISNAVKFTQKGNIRVMVRLVKAEQRSVRLYFEVTDSGVGIPPEKLATIFEPFQQANPDTFRLFGGTGLGLAIVKQLIELQGGTLQIESILGRGTTFMFELPFYLDESEPQPAPSASRFYHLKALIADDNAVNLLYLKKCLEDLGFEVSAVKSAPQVLEALHQEHFDILLSDWHMPGLSGEQMLRSIRLDMQLGQLPVVILSGTSSAEIENKLINGYLRKPFDSQALHLLLHRVLGKVEVAWSFIDLKALEKITLGDTAFMYELAEALLKESKVHMEELQKVVAGKDLKAIQMMVHKVKPSCTLLGNWNFQNLLEQLSLATQHDHTRIEGLTEELLLIYEGIEQELRSFLSQHTQA